MMMLVVAMVSPVSVWAQSAAIVPVDTIEMTATSVRPELDYNNGNFTYTLQDATWKVQVCYVGTDNYGSFTEADFYTEGSGSFNYIRNTRNDMQFWAFQTASIVVTNELGGTRIEVNALIKSGSTQWRRVLAHGLIPAPAVVDTVKMDMGQVAVQEDAFNNAIIMEAANADYSLAFGIGGQNHLTAGTYYMVDLLRPELVNLHSSDTIVADEALLVVTENGPYLDLAFSLRSEDDTLYQISMHTGATVVTDTVAIDCYSTQVSDYTSSYGFVLLAGESADYVASIALAPDSSVVYAFTTVARKSDQTTIRITDASLSVVTEADGHRSLRAELVGTNGTMYVVTLPVDYARLPEAVDTINVDFGNGVGRVDFSQGMGMMGLTLTKAGELDAHVVFYNGGSMKGLFDADYFDYDGCYITLYEENNLISFHDIKAAEIRLDSINDTLHITLDAINLGDTLYHMTAYLTPKRSLADGDHTYDISYAADGTGYDMVALQTYAGDDQYIYRIQFQRADAWTTTGEPIGDAELFEFRILQANWDGIQGTFGYSEDNMDPDRHHTIYEGGTEIYLGPVAGTVTFAPLQKVVAQLSASQKYNTYLYAISAQFVAENGQIYSLTGQNALICVDNVTGAFVELPEAELTALEDVLEEQGMRVKKVLENGVLLIEKEGQTFDATGRLIGNK